MAAPARCCERIANASWSARDTWNSSATFSPVSGIASTPYCAFIKGLMKRQPMVVSKISAEREKASPALPITNGARVIDSTPPAIARSISPARIARPAAPTASSPDAQSRLRVWPGTVSGRPANNSAMRATLRLSSPAWLAQPKKTSSTADQSSLGCRAIKALMGAAARSSARTLASEPPKRPIGVRTASHTNTSPIDLSLNIAVPRRSARASFRSGGAAGQLIALASAALSREVGYARRGGSLAKVLQRTEGFPTACRSVTATWSATAAPASYLCWRQPLDVDRALANLGQVVIHLHPEPGVRGATDGFFKLYSHFRRD